MQTTVDLGSLEKIVAAIVMDNPSQEDLEDCPDYATSVADAWRVVEFLRQQGWLLQISVHTYSVGIIATKEHLRHGISEPVAAGLDTTVEIEFCVAVCRLLLKINGYQVDILKVKQDEPEEDPEEATAWDGEHPIFRTEEFEGGEPWLREQITLMVKDQSTAPDPSIDEEEWEAMAAAQYGHDRPQLNSTFMRLLTKKQKLWLANNNLTLADINEGRTQGGLEEKAILLRINEKLGMKWYQ